MDRTPAARGKMRQRAAPDHRNRGFVRLPGRQEASKNSPRAGRDSLGVITTAPPKEIHMINRIRTLVVTAAGAAVLASGLGLAAVGAAGTANALKSGKIGRSSWPTGIKPASSLTSTKRTAR